ncbi:MAG TPA: hypothetical protein VFK18_02600 [Luteimonas sp.]|nr:hypothetical protein [Luteimonas sp.]
MDYDADELLLELERIDETLDEAARRAGEGCGPDFERRLGAHLRSLRNILGADELAVANDVMEAAERVMNAADPEAPLLMLQHARATLAAVIRRHANARLRPAA